jgi:hypothetical protein
MKGKFRELLQDTELPVSEHLWSSVSSQIGTAPVAATAPMAVGIKIAAALLLVSGIGAGLWLSKNNDEARLTASQARDPLVVETTNASADASIVGAEPLEEQPVLMPTSNNIQHVALGTATDNPTIRVRHDVQNVPPISALFDVTIKDSGQTQLKVQDPTGISNYHWNFGDGKESNLAQPAHQYNQSGSYEVALTAEDESGLAITSKQTVDVALPGQIEVMNVITPNADGQNDVFDPRALQPEAEITLLLVMSDQGQTIYESKEVPIWDGRLPNGELAPAGIYLYLIRGLDKNKGIIEKTSTLTLMR